MNSWITHLCQARNKAVLHPTIKFYDLKSKLFPTSRSPTPEDPEADLQIDEEDDSWLDLDNNEVHPESTLKASSYISLKSLELATFLADDKPNRASIVNPDNAAGNATMMATSLDNDNDFSINISHM